MVLAVSRPKAVVLLLYVVPIICRVLFCFAVISVLSSFETILQRNRELYVVVSLMSVDF